MSELDKVLSRLLDRETFLERYAEPLQKVLNQFFLNSGPLGRKIGDFLNGVWLGHPVHPVITDVPIGAWTAAAVLDMAESESGEPGIGKAADIAVALGVAGAVGSAVSGLADWQYTVGETRRTGFNHAVLNTVALTLYVASMFARGSRNRALGRSLAFTGYAIASLSAYLGGDMVYRQKMGVNHAPEEIDVKDFVPVMALNDLEENKLTLAMLPNLPIVLLRRGDQVYALAETCAHLGGPLADGQVTDSPDGMPAVVCPWHNSTFNMDNGNVIDGPSAYPQPCFETRIRDGQVEVRHRAESLD